MNLENRIAIYILVVEAILISTQIIVLTFFVCISDA